MSPTFRAERSDTNRHLSEFYMLEAEVSFVYTLTPLLDLVEDMIRTTVTQLRESRIGSEVLAHPPHSSPELEAAGLIPEPLVNKWDVLTPTTAWPRLTYSAAMKLLAEQHSTGKVVFQHTPDWADGLHSEHERFLAAHYNAPVFVTDYPSHIKPFYMLPTTDPAAVEEAEGRPTVACFDLLLPGIGELVGGSLRIHDLEMLKSEMIKRGMMKENGKGAEGMKWYEDLRRWGSVPHGGFGLGVERLMAYLGGVENVREVSAFPRWVGRCDC